MSDEDVFDQTDDSADFTQQNESHDLRQLRKKAKDADRYKAELDELRRERAFDKADLPDVPGMSFFRENYRGEMTEEAIKAEAAKHGLLAQTSQVEQEQQQAERAAQQRIAQATSSSLPPPPESWQAGLDEVARNAPPGRAGEAVAEYMRTHGRPVKDTAG